MFERPWPPFTLRSSGRSRESPSENPLRFARSRASAKSDQWKGGSLAVEERRCGGRPSVTRDCVSPGAVLETCNKAWSNTTTLALTSREIVRDLWPRQPQTGLARRDSLPRRLFRTWICRQRSSVVTLIVGNRSGCEKTHEFVGWVSLGPLRPQVKVQRERHLLWALTSASQLPFREKRPVTGPMRK